MKVAAIILDFDGVVADSMQLHLEAWSAATQALFGRALDDPQKLVGYGTQAIASIIAAKMGDTTLARQLASEKSRFMAAQPTPLFPGTHDFFAALQNSSIPYGVASNSPGSFVRPALASAGLIVPVVICGDDVARGKPRPDIFWACANQLAVHPRARGQVTVYEDSLHGIKAAVAAGMLAIGVATSKSKQDLLSAGARATCGGLAEALANGWLECLPDAEMV